ncbi:MAG TPA: FumA C-terminus/TtdB family hydratase beta subunit [Planctomycetota bacterium]|jgi:fumarate hydratase class I
MAQPNVKPFAYTKLFQLSPDSTEYRTLSTEHVSVETHAGQDLLRVADGGLELMASEAFADMAYFFRTAHLEQWAGILEDREASENDRFVAASLLRNAIISAGRVLPSCQDTGTATIMGWRGHRVMTEGHDEEVLSRGVYRTYTTHNLRYSQVAPKDMYSDVNTGTNLPAQIDIEAGHGDAYDFLFVAKGGGSANKTFLFPETPAILTPQKLREFLLASLPKLGVSACPPYHLAIVVGGTSPEKNLKTVKLASAGWLDNLPTSGDGSGRAFRDTALEAEVLDITRKVGLGAQFGGAWFALDVRVIRMPRHAASCFIGIGASCSAHRNIRGRITRSGVMLEALDKNPERFVSKLGALEGRRSVELNLERPMAEIRAELSRYPIGTQVNLTGTLIVARDIAHAKIKQIIDSGQPMPEYLKRYPVYYAGPAKTPAGMASGSFGPTTAQRMDPYVDEFMSKGASLVMLAKGNRAEIVTEACKKHGGFYLGTIGGAAALVAQHILSSEPVAFEELGMEAVRRITVKSLPAFIICDDKGNNLYNHKPGISGAKPAGH